MSRQKLKPNTPVTIIGSHITNGESGVVTGFDKASGKWHVEFDNSWHGYYHADDLLVDKT